MLWGQNLTETEINDLYSDHPITKIHKGEAATFSGALLPFNTLRKYEDFRISYEELRNDYILNGPPERGFVESFKKDVASDLCILTGGILAGYLLASTSGDIRYIGLGTSFVFFLGSVLVLSF